MSSKPSRVRAGAAIMKCPARFAAPFLFAALCLPASGQVARPVPGTTGTSDMMGVSTMRHRFVVLHGVPEPYAAMKDPLRRDPQAVAAGESLYREHCLRCHGARGEGDGPDAAALWPRIGNIASAMRSPLATDGYLYWTIAEGGEPLQSAMPAYRGKLKPDDIWRIVRYMRGL
jgi:cytochrome c5